MLCLLLYLHTDTLFLHKKSMGSKTGTKKMLTCWQNKYGQKRSLNHIATGPKQQSLRDLEMLMKKCSLPITSWRKSVGLMIQRSILNDHGPKTGATEVPDHGGCYRNKRWMRVFHQLVLIFRVLCFTGSKMVTHVSKTGSTTLAFTPS